MRYMILIYQDESKMAAVPKDAVTQMSSAYVDYTEAMKKAGVWLSGSALRVVPDFLGRRRPMDLRVGGIVELLRHDRIRQCGDQLLGLGYGAAEIEQILKAGA